MSTGPRNGGQACCDTPRLAARFDGAFPWRIEAGVLATRRPFVLHTDMKLLEPTLDALLAIAATIPETVLNTYR